MDSGDKHPESPVNGDDVQVAVTDTGNAAAASGATGVTGYRGPVPRPNTAPAAPMRVSGTGDATASEGGLANTGYIHQVSAGQLIMVQQRPPARWLAGRIRSALSRPGRSPSSTAPRWIGCG